MSETGTIWWSHGDINPCLVPSFLVSSLTQRQIQTQEVFMFVLTFAVFFSIIFLSFMVTHVKSRRVKIAKEKLALLDVLPGLTIYKNPDGAKLVQQKQKNISGGTATMVVFFGILALAAYVLATEFDLPGELGFQRRLTKSNNSRISFHSASLEGDRKVLSPSHELDIGFIFGVRRISPILPDPENLHFVSDINGPITWERHPCNIDRETPATYISTRYDFWKTPARADFVLCGSLPFRRTENRFMFYLRSEPVGTGAFRAPATVFDETLHRWDTSSPLDVFPRFEISVTAVTAYQLSVFLVDYILPPPRLHKVRVDSIVTHEKITMNACVNPIAQFTIIGNAWEIDGIFITGLSTVIISAIGAAGTLFGARTSIKSGFEWISKQYNSSTKKRKSLMILGYSIQTIVGALAAVGAVIAIFILGSEFTDHMIHASAATTWFVIIFAGCVWSYWIFSTVVFVRNMREFAAENNKNSAEIVNDEGDYVKLEDVQEE